MSIWNKVILGFLFVTTLVFFVFAARTLKTHAAWRTSIAAHEAAIAKLEDANSKLESDEASKTGIHQLKMALDKLTSERPRIWSNWVPRSVTPLTGVVKVTVDSPTPPQIAPNTVLYVFDDNDVSKGGRYLGKFFVKGVANKDAELHPAYALTPAQMTRLQQARGPWSLHENLPLDDHELFAELDEAAKKGMLPPSSLDEYLKDVQDEQKEWKRQLRDYKLLFDLYYRQHCDMVKQIEGATKDLQYLTTAVAGQTEQKKFCENTLAALKEELKTAETELQAVTSHQKNLEERLAAMNSAVEQLATQNRAAVAQLARAQGDAAQRIEERAKRMAQARSTMAPSP